MGHTFSPVSGREVRCYGVDEVAERVLELEAGSRVAVAAPLLLDKGQGLIEKLTLLLADGLLRLHVDGRTMLIEDFLPTVDEKSSAEGLSVVIDRLKVSTDDDAQTRLRARTDVFT